MAFVLISVTNDLELWVDQDTPPQSAVSLDSEWIDRMQGLVHDRLYQLWGGPTDVDHNGKVRVLLTPTLNDSGVAVGFFNPADLYSRVDTPGDDNNPISNEGEYLYLGVPSFDPFYSLNSLAATIAHEGLHLIHYGRRVMTPWLATGRVYPEETIGLSEGLAHLTEVLCGYGTSGGDVVFASRYLENPFTTSFTGPDLDGSVDTAAKRGGWTLFLGWLRTHHPRGEAALVDLLNPSASVGWVRLSQVLGSPADDWFLQWADDLEQGFPSGGEFDPITHESLRLTGSEGLVEWAPGHSVTLAGPRLTAFSDSMTLPDHSLVFWKPESWDLGAAMAASSTQGQGFLSLRWRGRSHSP